MSARPVPSGDSRGERFLTFFNLQRCLHWSTVYPTPHEVAPSLSPSPAASLAPHPLSEPSPSAVLFLVPAQVVPLRTVSAPLTSGPPDTLLSPQVMAPCHPAIPRLCRWNRRLPCFSMDPCSDSPDFVYNTFLEVCIKVYVQK